MVVWANHERCARDSVKDPWKRTLEYYEFLEDARRFTHLDQLLLRFGTDAIESVHLGTNESLKKNKRLERILESLQIFLEERHGEETSCHVHTSIGVDYPKMESTLQQLLLEDADVQLAVRGNVQLARGTLIQQGLSLFLQAQGLNTQSVDSDDWLHSSKLQKGVLNSHLVMDRTAADSIHLLPPPNAGAASFVGGQYANNSLYGLLSNPCLTQMGKQKLQIWLRQPLIDLTQIQQRQDAVTDLLGTGKDSIREGLRHFAGVDMVKLATTLGDCFVDGQDKLQVSPEKALKALYQLYLLSSQQLPCLLEEISNLETPSSPLLRAAQDDLASLVAESEKCAGLVEAVLDLEMAPRDFIIKPTYSEELQDLKEEIDQLQQDVDDELESMQQLWEDASPSGKPNQVRLEQLSDDRSWQFRLPNANDIKVLNTMGNSINTHRILKNGVYFSTKPLRALSSKYQDLMDAYGKHSKQVVRDAMGVAVTYQTVVERASQVVATLDVLCALAYTAAFSPHGYCKPTLTDGEENGLGIDLKAARHPCVELQEDVEFIPNDFSLKFGESNFLVVTGPNMGGKSTVSCFVLFLVIKRYNHIS